MSDLSDLIERLEEFLNNDWLSDRMSVYSTETVEEAITALREQDD